MSDVQRKNRYLYLSRSLKEIGKCVGRGKKHAIAEAVIVLRNEVVATLGTAACKISKICSDSHDSILRMKTPWNFSAGRVWLELQMHAPLLVALLVQLLPPSKCKAEDDTSCSLRMC